jgi:hypothetical protein
MATKSTLGIRNKNYLNVKNNPSNPWKGSISTDSRGHAKFSDPAWGIRAAIMVLRTYWFTYRLRTVAQILSRWAPSSDTIGSIVGAPANSPVEYTRFVCGRMGFAANQPLRLFKADRTLDNFRQLKALVESMAEYENYVGFNVPDGEFERALYLI